MNLMIHFLSRIQHKYKGIPNLMKGIVIGGMLSAGLVMLYADTIGLNKKKAMKQGKKMIKKMGF